MKGGIPLVAVGHATSLFLAVSFAWPLTWRFRSGQCTKPGVGYCPASNGSAGRAPSWVCPRGPSAVCRLRAGYAWFFLPVADFADYRDVPGSGVDVRPPGPPESSEDGGDILFHWRDSSRGQIIGAVLVSTRRRWTRATISSAMSESISRKQSFAKQTCPRLSACVVRNRFRSPDGCRWPVRIPSIPSGPGERRYGRMPARPNALRRSRHP